MSIAESPLFLYVHSAPQLALKDFAEGGAQLAVETCEFARALLQALEGHLRLFNLKQPLPDWPFIHAIRALTDASAELRLPSGQLRYSREPFRQCACIGFLAIL